MKNNNNFPYLKWKNTRMARRQNYKFDFVG